MFKEVLETIRIKQWAKNLIVFAPLIFSGNFNDPMKFFYVCILFASFCLISSCIYIFNDIHDEKEDRKNPLKSSRPIVSGRLNHVSAYLVALGLFVPSQVLGFICEGWIFINTYFVLMIAYTFLLKKVVIIDALVISFGFLIRVVSGGLILKVEISPWILICTLLLSLFIAFCKRRAELFRLAPGNSGREVLEMYDEKMLDLIIASLSSATLVSYMFYTLGTRTLTQVSSGLVYSVPFVVYGLFRYMYIVYKIKGGGKPEESLFSDKPLLLSIFLWVVSVVFILLRFPPVSP